jgi:hypothetical protein
MVPRSPAFVGKRRDAELEVRGDNGLLLTESPHGGFTTAGAQPWLPAIAVAGGGVA